MSILNKIDYLEKRLKKAEGRIRQLEDVHFERSAVDKTTAAKLIGCDRKLIPVLVDAGLLIEVEKPGYKKKYIQTDSINKYKETIKEYGIDQKITAQIIFDIEMSKLKKVS